MTSLAMLSDLASFEGCVLKDGTPYQAKAEEYQRKIEAMRSQDIFVKSLDRLLDDVSPGSSQSEAPDKCRIIVQTLLPDAERPAFKAFYTRWLAHLFGGGRLSIEDFLDMMSLKFLPDYVGVESILQIAIHMEDVLNLFPFIIKNSRLQFARRYRLIEDI